VTWAAGLRAAGASWRRHNGTLLAAGLAYFALIALVPLLLLAAMAAGLFLGEDAARGDLMRLVQLYAGAPVATAINGFLSNAHAAAQTHTWIISLIVPLWCAAQIFHHLHNALNAIWEVPPHRGVRRVLRRSVTSFSMVMAMGLALFLLFFVNAGLDAARRVLGAVLPVLSWVPLWKLLHFTSASFVVAGISAALYKSLPEAPVDWRDALVGSAVGAGLTVVATYALGFFFRFSPVLSVYGAAGTLFVLLAWCYFAAAFFLYGAEFAHVRAVTRRSSPLP
jgi:membrane protein